MIRRRKTWVESARRRPSWRFGLIVVAIMAAGVYLAFAKELPWSGRGYEVHAIFRSAATLRPDSPVRIAGVNVGKVVAVEPHGDAAEVTFTVSDEGRPVHEDATVAIRPRLFLEGNFFLDLRPGSPSTDELPSGGTIPITSTSRAVQLDEILTALQRPNRQDLAQLLEGAGAALTGEPTPAEDLSQDPDVRDETAAQAIHDSFRYGARAGRGSAQTSEALLGKRPHDLSILIASQSRVFGALLSHEQQLQDLITDFNVTTGALAAESSSLSATIRRLAPTLEQARPALRNLSDALPPLRALAIELTPSLEPLPATIRAGTPWLAQALQLTGRDELGGIAAKLERATPPLASTVHVSPQLFAAFRLTSRCVSDTLIPTGNQVISSSSDPYGFTGQPNYRDFLYGVVNFTGAGQPFDGNGPYLRAAAAGGDQLVAADKVPSGGPQNDSVWGLSEAQPVGTQPIVSGDAPPYRPNLACHRNGSPALNGPPGPPSPHFVTTVP